MYRLLLTKEFDRCLAGFNKHDREQIDKKIVLYMAPQLKQEPHVGLNIKKLRGSDPEIWRYRIGKFRLFYLIDEAEKIVKMLSLVQRKDAY